METNILPGTTPESPAEEKTAAEESVLEIVRRLFLIVSSQPEEDRFRIKSGSAQEVPSTVINNI